jgi:TM2 domain-containing membrane protein YozV
MSWDVSGALGAPFGYDPSYDSWIGYGDAYAPIPARPTTAPVIPLTHIPPVHGTPKERGTYILLGLLLGSFGAHNFYAGRRKHAIAQASLTVGTLLYGALAMWIWALLEVCTVDRDGNDVPFA